MTRYFFDLIVNGSPHKDEVGIPLAAIEDVRMEAMRGLPGILGDEVLKTGGSQECIAVVSDESGKPIYTATVNFAEGWLA